MKFIGRNATLLEILRKEPYIPNSEIIGFKIQVIDFELFIEVDLRILYREEEYMKLKFFKIKEYAFNYSSDRIFYNIEVYKLLKKEKLFYISFDPEYGDLSRICENDNDLIICGDIEGYFHR